MGIARPPFSYIQGPWAFPPKQKELPGGAMDWQDEYERKKITVNQVFEQHLTGNQKI